MIASIEGSLVTIGGSAIEILRLKTELAGRLGTLVSNKGRLAIQFPKSALSVVRDILPTIIASVSPVADVLKADEDHAVGREAARARLEATHTDSIPARWVEVLDPGQAVAVAALSTPGIHGMCLFDEQGTGKTVMAIAAFDTMREQGEIDGLIVVAPKSMMSEWPEELRRFLSPSLSILEGPAELRANRKPIESVDAIVINYDSLATLANVLGSVARNRRYLLVVDESYYAKNAKAKRSKALFHLRAACKRCILLCGTPAPNSPYDIVNQFDLADGGFAFAGFRPSDDASVDASEIEHRIQTRGLFARRLKTEMIPGIAAKEFEIIRVPLTGRQATLYESGRQKLILELRGIDNRVFRRRLSSYFQRRSALLQVCAHPQSIDPLAPPSAKLARLDILLADLIGQGRKVVIWSFFTATIDEILNRYAAFNPVLIDGRVSRKDRKNAITAFQDSDDAMLFVGNPAAAGAGITLHASYDAVYYSFSNQAAQYLQSLDRIHRRGQKAHTVNYYFLVCENTIEETEIRRLRQKELTQHSLLGDAIVFPSSVDEALAELYNDAT